MNINWTLIIVIGVVLAAIVIFLVIMNLEEKKSREHKLKEDYRKSKGNENTTGPDDVKNS